MEACAPDLEWPGAQNSYHAPGVRSGAANLIYLLGPGGNGGGCGQQPGKALRRQGRDS